jgi:hypothetical protein
MLKNITYTEHVRTKRWGNWIVSVPDDMDDESITNAMQAVVGNSELELDKERDFFDEDDVSVDIAEASPDGATPDFTLDEDGIVEEDEDAMPTAFTPQSLHEELERRNARDCA